MSDDIIARAEAALEGVTDGPWVSEYSGEQGNCVIPHDAQSTREAVCTTHLYYQAADAAFIAAARSLVPELVAELKTTRAQLETLRAGLTRVEHFARIVAHTTRHDKERYWLDLLALIERAEVADV
ncbi:hypothetical protein ACX9NE_26940 [Mycobacterium sp. ML4]